MELPRYGYKLIIFRAHGGLLTVKKGSQVEVRVVTYVFTAEEYEETKYVREQLDAQMLPGEMGQDLPPVFAINSKFVLKSMRGKF